MGVLNLEEPSSAIEQSFFQHAPDATMLLDCESTKILQCNLAAQELLSASEQQLLGLRLSDISAEIQQGITPSLNSTSLLGYVREKADIARSEGKVRFEWICKGGNNDNIDCDIALCKTTLNSVDYLLCSIRDIGEFKKREKHLIDINDRFNLAITASGMGIWQWDITTGDLIWSDRLFQMLGYEAQEVTPTLEFWQQTLHPDEADTVLAALQNHLENNKPYVLELRSKCKDGKYRWFKTSGFVKRNSQGEAINMAGLFDDIDHQKEVELANKRLLELLDASSDFIGQADVNKNLTYLNPAFKKLVGFGTPGRQDIPDWHPAEDLKKLDEVIFPHTLKHGSWRGEVNLLDVEGKVIPCSLLELAHQNDKGEYETFSAIFRDISDLKKQEAELLKQTKISEHQSKLAAIGQLASGVGHEINNPLAIIKGYVEGSLYELKSQNNIAPAKLMERFEKINAAIERISKITQGLRSFARNDTEDTEVCSIGDMVHESCGLIQEIYLKDGIELEVKNLSEFYETYVCVNKGKFQQVLMNLLVNAKDAIEEVSIKTISIDLQKCDGVIQIGVRDSGVGIPEKIIDKIFDPFYTTKGVNKGTGLGLSFVQEYIQEMNGTVGVTSVPLQCTTFTISIPEVSKDINNAKDVAVESLKKTTARSLNILVVEDEEALREFYQSILELAGHDIAACCDGSQALQQMIDSPEEYDVVLSDMRMPVMGGAELLKLVRTNHTIRQPKFVMLTGGVDVNFMSDNDELNRLSDGFLFKPFNGESLVSAIDALFV